MKSLNSMRKAMTLIEIIFVIVVLGIVASLGSEMIAQVYKRYVLQHAIHRAEIKTELASLQIANRLANAIPGTLYRKRFYNANQDWTENLDDFIQHPNNADQYNVLQWVGADTDSFATSSTPGWSGFADINRSDANATSTILYSPGSDFNLSKTVITNLNGGAFPAAWKISLFFPNGLSQAYVQSDLQGSSLVLSDSAVGGNKVSDIAEQYKLAWTSYALVVEKSNPGDATGDLYLYYGFDPIPGWMIPNTTKKSLLLKNVSTFKFKKEGPTIRFKICKSENIGEDYNVTACKEKAVF